MKGHSILPFFDPTLSSLAKIYISKEFLRLFHLPLSSLAKTFISKEFLRLFRLSLSCSKVRRSLLLCISRANHICYIDKLDTYTKTSVQVRRLYKCKCVMLLFSKLARTVITVCFTVLEL